MTQRAAGPTKKLVPSLSSDRTCEHRFTEEDGITLEVECTDCSGAQSIDNHKCAAGIVNILASGVVPEAIVLKRHMHVRYRSESMRRLRDAGSALAVLRRIEAQPDGASDRRCRTCPASRRRMAAELTRRIRADPCAFRASKAAVSDSILEGLKDVGCPDAPACVEQFAFSVTLGRGVV